MINLSAIAANAIGWSYTELLAAMAVNAVPIRHIIALNPPTQFLLEVCQEWRSPGGITPPGYHMYGFFVRWHRAGVLNRIRDALFLAALAEILQPAVAACGKAIEVGVWQCGPASSRIARSRRHRTELLMISKWCGEPDGT